ncbi:hypothetical protein [Halococcus thailandensis]|uniref:Uncharacterized protein n=1 Tax=Halococcus thailandensis JCM 13552 TaxID=1227457 RepID=M0N0P5_9EURY|nr:hypothetical protein [Halococcus thailandensis]EMA51118.1 hypothetical protein C451_15528 [Halococcus thailandensis JCM 13552]
MRRRDYLRGLGAIAGIVGVAGCSSSASEEPAAGPTAQEPAGNASDESRTERTAPGSVTTRTVDESTASPTAQPTTTATEVPTPEPPANRLLLAPALGTSWGYASDSAPRVRDNGTITALYRGTQSYTRTLRTRLWPCEGQTLDALGGTCSLGSLPRRYRSRDDIETADPAIGETAFAWWSGPRTDMEVVAADHVFRMTHMPLAAQADESTASLPSRAARLTELIGFARQQADKLASFG